ncbi:hypothetical protein [Pajaroellobacter abortibovis]|uniref:Uncharacterized protein n=1 Tax=Pajaroellobacter abortibovis TaxID=1882918 RepID=A0A1L6MXG6_9BACT|nr:hypothetical protein [Pajaroellobacter abortibovis]APS00156.1 hypothetical protein BCY86_05275 [Pajaroellobacter abortibovis]
MTWLLRFTRSDLNRLQKWQVRFINLQTTDQMAGFVHHFFPLADPTSQTTSYVNNKKELFVDIDRSLLRLQLKTGELIEGTECVREIFPQGEISPPGSLLTWLADRTRAMSCFENRGIQWVKAISLTILHWIRHIIKNTFSEQLIESEVMTELGSRNQENPHSTFTDPEIRWTPAPILTLVIPPLAGAEEWDSLDGDPFIGHTQGSSSGFVTLFTHPNIHQSLLRIYMSLWDPPQIQLHMAAGSVEPVSATRETGTGFIPRKIHILRRLVAGFNEGFQAIHGESGMQVNCILYLPPKPYAATILTLEDGSNAMGSWPASTEIPSEVLSYRQNLTALIENGKFNPWLRTW